MRAVAELAAVTVTRGRSVLLDNIELRINEDERWVVIGPNGAGKTTMLQLLAAQSHPTSGIVALLGELVGTVDVFELRPRIGLTSSALAERVPKGEKVRDLVVSAAYAVVGRWNESYDEADFARAEELLAQFRIAEFGERTFGTLSTGEQKRVQIARALMTDPELLLLDEPASGLDIAGREDLVRALSQLFRDPAAPATVLVTHHLEEIPDGVTHCMLLSRGRIVAAGPIRETLNSENLSAAFGTALQVNFDGRWSARGIE
ncbi:ABC transporter ATP-binding protein [Tessaracoccus sp. OH4464_COT-324]|uniref:ABC transporter ATP-binding protein n=1 Tax=Tessaracoccus sp. OH4464_COT-324 TaxID=2491059 RepID=UPI000F63AF40|nr:ABC transporter ATP-binding protein [Tessaracoccus sp. OH4464_COT-324]RRD47733.1 ABC transporter ATP-binding protein [Tessaracoccus sp. OH4464_COT-324]